MAKKDFSQINTGRVYDTIAAATAEPAQEQKTQKKKKPRKSYTEQEKQEILESLQTAGRKGCKLPRINLAFSPQLYEYVSIMSRVRGETLTRFVNLALQEHMNNHRDIYEKAMEFRRALDTDTI